MTGNRQDNHPISRREFLKTAALAGGFVVLSPVLSACAKISTPVSGTAALTSVSVPIVKEGKMTDVALVKTSNRIEGVKKAIKLLDLKPFTDKKVALKPNFNSADPTPGSTHIDTLRSLVESLQQMGSKQVTLAERSGPGDSTRTVMEKKGAFRLADELGFDIMNLEEMVPDGWTKIVPPDSHWRQGFLFPRFYLEADSIVQTCCLKTHAYGGHFTLSLKNSVGLVPRSGYPYMSELHSSSFQRQMIAEINTAYSPDLIVMDGVEAFVDGGPAQGTKVDAGVMLAATDRVAIDAVGVAILRLLGTTREVSRGAVFEQDQLKRAAELKVGVSSPGQINIVTADPESEVFAGQVRNILMADS